MEIVKRLLWIYFLLYMVELIIICQGKVCNHPGVPANAHVVFSSSESFIPGTYAKYTCEVGYELFGSGGKICHEKGEWTNDTTFCAMNVAVNKPSVYQILKETTFYENDGDSSTCANVFLRGLWKVNLLKTYDIAVIRIWGLIKEIDPGKELAIYVSLYSSGVNFKCKSHAKNNGIIEFYCPPKTRGQYVSIGFHGDNKSRICEVAVYSITGDISLHQCSGSLTPYHPFDGLCYYFYDKEGSWFEARTFCQIKGGTLVHGISEARQQYLEYQLNRISKKLNKTTFWIGQFANNVRRFSTSTPMWHWVNETSSQLLGSSSDRDNNPKFCRAVDGTGKWIVQTWKCTEKRSWICQFGAVSCPNPGQPPSSTILENVRDFQVEESAHYKCDEGYTMFGNNLITCESNGLWNEQPPLCTIIDCGLPAVPANGSVLYYNTSFNSIATYQCDAGLQLIGNVEAFCQKNGTWNDSVPLCQAIQIHSSCTGKIIGGFVGILIFLIILIGVLIYLWKKHLLPRTCFGKNQSTYFTVEYNLNSSQDRNSGIDATGKRSSVNHYIPPAADIDVLYAKVDPRKKKLSKKVSNTLNNECKDNIENKNKVDCIINPIDDGVNYENLKLNRLPIQKPPRKLLTKNKSDGDHMTTLNEDKNMEDNFHNYAVPHYNDNIVKTPTNQNLSVINNKQFESPLIPAYAETDILIYPQQDYEEIPEVKT